MSTDQPGEHGRDDPDWPDTLVVPDDPSELRADEIALRRERAAARRRERWYRLTGGSRLRAYGVSLPLLLVAALAVAGFGALLVLLGPRSSPGPAPTPAGATPTAAIGRPGGRLPPVGLTLPDGAPMLASALGGPAAVLLVPTGCDCARTIDVAADRALRSGLRVAVVEPTAATAAGLDAAGAREVTGYADPTGRLLATYGSTGSAPTLLVLDAEGAVRTVQTGITAAAAAAAFPAVPVG